MRKRTYFLVLALAVLVFWPTLAQKKATSMTPAFKNDQGQYGWSIVENCPVLPGQTLIINEVIQGNESVVSGAVMLSRVKSQGKLAGQLHAEKFIQPDKIPTEWRDFYLLFPGTIWRSADNKQYIPALNWNGSSWEIAFEPLASNFGKFTRVVRFQQP